MNVGPLDHIGMAVRDAEAAAAFYADVLGLQLVTRETVESMKLRIVKVRSANVTLELLQPLEGEETVSKFLQTRGEGIHHICFEVGDIEQAADDLRKQGYQPLWGRARVGSGQRLVHFLHPRKTNGVLIELRQKSTSSTEA